MIIDNVRELYFHAPEQSAPRLRQNCWVINDGIRGRAKRQKGVSTSSSCDINNSILREQNQSWKAPSLLLCAHLSNTSTLCVHDKHDRKGENSVVTAEGTTEQIFRDHSGS